MANLSNINGKFVVEQTTGFVGIGTTDPAYLLHVNSSDVTNGTRLIIENTNGSGKKYGLISDNTGVFTVRDITAGADRFSISNLGNVGIGIFPTRQLSVLDRINIQASSTSGSANLLFGDSGDDGIGQIKYDNSDNSMRFQVNNAETMRIDSSGDVTIQTSGADDIKNLTINSSNGSSQVAGFVIQNDGANGYIHFKAGAGNATPTTKLTIGNAANSGNVGIGTDLPDSLLVVQADAHNEAFAGKRSATEYLWFLRNENNSGRFQLYNSSSNHTIEMTGANGRITAAQGIFGSAFALTSNGYATFGSTSSSVPIAFAIDGDGSSPEMFIKTDGNVGIGTTTNINAPLTVQASGGANAINIIGRDNGTADESIIDFYQNNGTTRMAYMLADDGNLDFATGGSTVRMRITSTGDTQLSGNNLDIKGTSAGNTSIRINDSTGTVGTDSLDLINDGTAAYIWNRASTPIRFGIGGTERMRITSAGGISFGSTGTAYGASGQVLTSNGNAAPTWQAAGGSSPWTTSGNNIYYTTGNVSIGTSSTGFSSDYDNLIVGTGSGDNGIGIYSGTTGNSTLAFIPDTGGVSDFQIRVEHDYPFGNMEVYFQHSSDYYLRMFERSSGQDPIIKVGNNSIPLGLNTGDDAIMQFRPENSNWFPAIAINAEDSGGNSRGFIEMKSNRSQTSSADYFLKFFNYNSNEIGSIRVNNNNNNVAYNTSSDYRMKEDLKEFKALDTVSKIKVYNYKWKDDSSGFRDQGILAHELDELIPQAVSGEKDATDKDNNILPQSVDYSKIVPHLVQSIQELKAEIEILKNK